MSALNEALIFIKEADKPDKHDEEIIVTRQSIECWNVFYSTINKKPNHRRNLEWDEANYFINACKRFGMKKTKQIY